jgi:hypothetical protein
MHGVGLAVVHLVRRHEADAEVIMVLPGEGLATRAIR